MVAAALLGVASTGRAENLNFSGSGTVRFIASDWADYLGGGTTFNSGSDGGRVYWRGTAGDGQYIHFDLSRLQGVTLTSGASITLQNSNPTWGGSVDGSYIATANGAWRATSGSGVPGATAIGDATNPTGSYGWGAPVTWGVGQTGLQALVDNAASFNGFAIIGGSGSQMHFNGPLDPYMTFTTSSSMADVVTVTGGGAWDSSKYSFLDGVLTITGAVVGGQSGAGNVTINALGTVHVDGTGGDNYYWAVDSTRINRGLLLLRGHSHLRNLTLAGGELGGIRPNGTWGGWTFDDVTTVTGGVVSTISAQQVNLDNGTFAVDAGSTLRFTGSIRAGSLTKTGPGTMVLSGNTNHTGGTTVDAGLLVLSGGAWIFNNVDGSGVTVRNGAILRADNTVANRLSGLTLDGGTVDAVNSGGNGDWGNFFLTGNVSAGGASALNADIALRAASVDFNVAAGGTLDVGGVLHGGYQFGGAGISKSGSGTIVLSGANTFGGQLYINAGTLIAANNTALGAGGHNGATMAIINDGSTLALRGGISLDEHFHVWGAGVGGLGAVRSLSGDNALTNAPNGGPGYCLRSDTTVGVDAGMLTISGFYQDQGSFSLTKVGAGTLRLTADNSYTGGTVVNGGTLLLAGNGGWGRIRGALTVNAGGTVVTTGDGTGFGFYDQLNTLTVNGGLVRVEGSAHIWNLTGGVTMTGGELRTNDGVSAAAGNSFQWNRTSLTTNASAAAAVISGHVNLRGDSGYSRWNVNVADGAAATDLLVSAVVTGNGVALAKSGAGTLVLSALNTYAGGTTVSAGTLTIDRQGNNGQSAVGANTPVTVAAGATLRLAQTDGLGYYGANPSSLVIAGAMTIAAGKHASIGNFGLTLDGGTLTSEGPGNENGNYILDGTVTTLANASSSVISANTVLLRNGDVGGNQAVTFAVADGAAPTDLSVSSALANANGANGLTKAGNGTLVLSGANTYTGATVINAGTLALDAAGGTYAYVGGDIAIHNGATLRVSGQAYTFGGKTIAFGASGGGALDAVATGAGGMYLTADSAITTAGGAQNTLSGTRLSGQNQGINLNFRNLTLDVAEGADPAVPNLHVTATIWNGGDLIKNGGGTLLLSGGNEYAGATTVNSGTLALAGAGSLNGSSGVTVGGAGLASLVHNSSVQLTAPVTLANGMVTGTGSFGAISVADLASNKLAPGVNGVGTLSVGTLGFLGQGALDFTATGTAATNLLSVGTLDIANGGTVTVNVLGVPQGSWVTGTYDLITYSSVGGLGVAGLVKGSVSGATSRTISDLKTDVLGKVSLVISSETPKWTGLDGAEWKVGPTGANKNWKLSTDEATDYVQGDAVIFDDSGANRHLLLGAGVAPTAVIFNNTLPYSLSVLSDNDVGFITGPTGLVKNGSGELQVFTLNDYTGATVINAGRITVSPEAQIGFLAPLTLAGGQLDLGGVQGQQTVGAVNITGAAPSGDTIGNGALVAQTYAASHASGDAIVSANLRGTNATFTKTGNGTLTLSGDNTFNGGFTLGGGVVNVNSDTALGAATLVINGGALDNTSGAPRTLGGLTGVTWNSDFTFVGTGSLDFGLTPVTLGGSRTVTVQGSTLTVGGLLGGAVSLTKSGNGTLALTHAANTYSGGTTVNGGTLLLTGAFPGGPLVLNGGRFVNGASSSTSYALTSLVLNGGELAATSSPDASYGNYQLRTNVTIGGSSMSTISADVRVGDNATRTFDVADADGGSGVDLLLSGKLGHYNGNSWGYATKTGAGTLKLSGVNEIGGLTVNAGLLVLEDAGIGGMQSTGFSNNASAELRVTAGTVNAGFSISGSGTLAKTGSGTLVLSANNVFSGGLTIDGGMVVASRSPQDNGALTLGTGAIVVNNGGTLRSAANWATGSPWNPASVGGITVNAGGAWTIDNLGQAVRNGLFLNGGVVNGPGENGDWGGLLLWSTLTAGGAAVSTVSVDTAMDGVRGFEVGAGSRLEFTGKIHNQYQANAGINKTGAGTLVLSGPNTYTGLTIFAGGVVEVASIGNNGTAGSLGVGTGDTDGDNIGLLFRGGVLRYAGATAQSTDRAIRLGTSGGTIDASGSTPSATLTFTRASMPNWWDGGGTRTLTLTGANTGANTLTAGINDFGGNVTTMHVNKEGAGTWVLAGAGNYIGVTDIKAGMLIAASNGALGAGGYDGATMSHIRAGATLALQGGVSLDEHFHVWGAGVGGLGAVRSLSGDNALTIGGNNGNGFALRSNTVVGVDADRLTVTGFYEEGGNFSLTKIGDGTLVLTATNAYTGGTVVNGGTLSLAGTGGDGRIRGTLTVNAGATVVTTGDGTGFGWKLPEQGGVKLSKIVINGGTITSAGVNHIWDLAGGVEMTGGTLQSNQGISTADGPQLEWRNADVTTFASATPATIAGRIRLRADGGSGLALNIADGAAGIDLLISAAITQEYGLQGLTKSGAGALVLSALNTYTGATTVNGGTLRVASLGTTGGSSVGASDRADAANLALNGAVRLEYAGAGESTSRSFTVSGSGATLASSGAGAIDFTSSAKVAFAADGGSARELRFAGTNNGNNTFAASAVGDPAAADVFRRIVKNEVGKWVIAGSGTAFAGNLQVEVNGGVLAFAQASTLGSGASVVNGGSLLVSSGQNANASVTVNNGGLLGGSASLGSVVVNTGGTLAPGASPGILGASSLSLAGGSTVQWQVYDALGVAGTGYDRLVVTGNLDLRGASPANKVVLKISSLSAPDTDGNPLNFGLPTGGDSFRTFQFGQVGGLLLNNGQNISDVFSFDLTDFTYTGGTASNAGLWSINWDSGTGAITLTAVPEPSTYGLGLGALALAAAALRRRRRQAPKA